MQGGEAAGSVEQGCVAAGVMVEGVVAHFLYYSFGLLIFGIIEGGGPFGGMGKGEYRFGFVGGTPERGRKS